MTGVRIALWIAFVPLLFALGACSTSKGARSGSGADGAASRGGGYYLDDGPGHLSPADVAAIPDAVPRAEPVLLRTARPYTVFGRTYVPMSQLAPYSERGIASWYGRRYHGKPTSSGEPYDMYAMTAAHPTLPIPSYVRVTPAGTGRSVVVRVNDRGPFLQNRLIDLSYTAAAKLGFVEAGSAEVEIEAITRFDAPGAPLLVAGISPGAVQDGAVAGPAPAAAPAAQTESAPGGVASPVGAPVTLTVSSAGVDSPPASPTPENLPGRLVVETRFSGESREFDAPSAATTQAVALASAPAGPSAERVSAERASMPSSPAPQAGAKADAPGFWLQLGAFASADGARAALERFRREFAWLGARFDLHHEGGLYKVQAGPWPQREHALDAAARVRGATALQPFPIFR